MPPFVLIGGIANDCFAVSGETGRSMPHPAISYCCDCVPSMISPAGGMGPVMPASPLGVF